MGKVFGLTFMHEIALKVDIKNIYNRNILINERKSVKKQFFCEIEKKIITNVWFVLN